MVIQVSKTKTYIPTFNGNKDIPATEQIVVTYKNPTVQMRERLIPRPQSKGKASTTGAVETFEIVLSDPNKTQILKEMIQTISNCSYEEDGQIKNINNATELLNAPSEFNGLVDEIFGQCQKELQKTVPEKN